MSDYKIVKAIHNGCEYDFGGGGETYYNLDILVVGGGAGGQNQSWGCGGGGGGQVIYGCYAFKDTCFSVSIGTGGGGESNGCPTTITSNSATIKANGGTTPSYYSGSGNRGGYSGSMCAGGNGCSYSCITYCNASGGGGGAGGNGCAYNDNRGSGGAGICGYGGGGGGGWYGYGCDGGGAAGCNADNYGGGGGGGGFCGCQGVAIICYHTDGTDGFSCATGGTVTTDGDYTIHTFTSNGTFCIVS